VKILSRGNVVPPEVCLFLNNVLKNGTHSDISHAMGVMYLFTLFSRLT